jgi:hypothetical protein
MSRRPTPAVLAATGGALAAAIAGTLAITSNGGAQTPTPQPTVMHVQRRVTDGGFIDVKPRHRQSPGDAIVESSVLRDATGNRLGRAIDHCITIDHHDTLACTGVVLLARGTLIFAGRTGMDGKPSTFAVTGGTRAYAGARGFIDDVPTGENTANATLTLLPTP